MRRLILPLTLALLAACEAADTSKQDATRASARMGLASIAPDTAAARADAHAALDAALNAFARAVPPDTVTDTVTVPAPVPPDTIRPDSTPTPPDTQPTPPDTTTPPPPIPQPIPGGSNEPAGFVRISDRDWSCKAAADSDRGPCTGSPAHGSQGWDGVESRYGNLQIVSDPTAPKSGPMVAQMKYPAGMTAGRAPGTAQLPIKTSPLPRQLYVSFWAKTSATFSGNQSNTNKTIFLWLAGAGNRVFLSMEGGFSNPLYWTVRYQASTASGANPAPRLGHVNKAAALVTRGQWQRIELVQTLGTPGGKNSSVRLYVNGVLVTTADNVDLIGPGENIAGFNQVQWSPTFGGGGAAVPHDMYLWFDHVYVSGK